MKFKNTKLLIGILLITALSLNIFGCSIKYVNITKEKLPLGELKVTYIDVGQADSILVECEDKNLLIDSGTNETGDNVIKYLKGEGITKIDYVIATHPHEDHIGGMANVIKGFDIGKFYSPKASSNTKTFERMITELNDKGLKINVLKVGKDPEINIPGTKIEIFSPGKDEYENLNNYSPIMKLTYGETTFLFTGDAEKEIEKEVLENKFDIKADVLKVGHHGSSTSTSIEFLKKVSPEYAIISVGKDNKYKHPNDSTIKNLNKNNVKVLRTDILGNITLKSDGNVIELEEK